jgi:hypothetical protein
MPDPIDTFKLPPELSDLLSPADQKKLVATILDIDIRLFKDDPEIEAGRQRGKHLWLLFAAIAAPLRHLSDFKERLVPDFIPRMIEEIRREMKWYPHNGVDLREFHLLPPMREWRNVNLMQEDEVPRAAKDTTIRADSPSPATGTLAPVAVVVEPGQDTDARPDLLSYPTPDSPMPPDGSIDLRQHRPTSHQELHRKNRGRKSKFSKEQLDQARRMKATKETNNEIAKVLYGPNPTDAQRRSVPTILKYHFESTNKVEK